MQGFSGAKIEPVIAYKKTASDAYEQALRCVELGVNVCPQIYNIGQDAYLMEELFPPGAPDFLALKRLLSQHVWSRSKKINPWKHDFHLWMEKTESQFLIKFVESLYPDLSQTHGGCETHGDPTWANVMRNRKGELRLIDPLPNRPEKPKLREVDLGKMLQSAIGWEDVLMKRAYFNIDALAKTDVLAGEDEETCQKAKFWLKVHLWRLLPFAEKNRRQDIAMKAKDAVHAICL